MKSVITMQKISYIITALFISFYLNAQNIDRSQGFQGGNSVGTGGTIWPFTQTGTGSVSTGQNNSPGNPDLANLFYEDTSGWQLNNTTNAAETSVLEFDNITGLTGTGRFVEFRLAGMGKTDTDGVDNGDNVIVEVRINSGAWQTEATITPATSTPNLGWSITGGGIFTKTANNTNTTVNNNPSLVRIYFSDTPTSPNAIQLRITLSNNQNQERWVIDDVRLGTIAVAPVVADFEVGSSATQWVYSDIPNATNVGAGTITQAGSISTGTNTTPGKPAGANLFAAAHPAPPTAHTTQARGFQLNNTSNALALAGIELAMTAIEPDLDNFVEFNLAGMGKNANNVGVDPTDFVEIQIKINDAATFSRELIIQSGGNDRGWAFTATGVVIRNYDGDNVPLTAASGDGAGGIARVRINLPPNAYQVAARIIMRNDANNERWVIDNVRLASPLTPPTEPPMPSNVFTYEGFDNYEINGTVQDFTISKNTKTVASTFPTDDLSIHQFATDFFARYQSVNSEVSLGWAGDWITSDGSDAYYIGGIASGSEQDYVQQSSYPLTSADQTNSLINSGLFLQRSNAPIGPSVGRRIQTSTGGPYYQYRILGAPLAPGVNPITIGAVNTLSYSTIRMTDNTTFQTNRVNHNTAATEPNPANRTVTNNTCIGADGTTVWFAAMVRKGASTNDPCYVSLHKFSNVYDITTESGVDKAIQVGYFGTASNSGGNRFWGFRVGNGPVQIGSSPSATSNNRIQTSQDDTPSGTNYRGDEFDLLVLRIDFNYGGNKDRTVTTDDNHRIRMYVIRDYKRTTHPSHNNPKPVGENFEDFIANPSLLDTNFDIEQTGIQGDIGFHSLSFMASPGYTGPSGIPGVVSDLYFSDAIDEIRFGSDFAAAALYSPVVALVKGLCEQNGGTSGDNIFPEGTFGVAESLNPDGTIATGYSYPGTPAPGEVFATGGSSRYAPAENVNANERNPAISTTDPVVFENGTATIPGSSPSITYNALTGANYIYVFNQPNCCYPNDGAYTVVTQSRHQFGASANNPSWYPTYDNTNENKNGLLMNVNAAYAKGVFYAKTVDGICADTQYEFYADIFNTLRATRRTVTNIGGTQGAFLCDPAVEPGCQQMSTAGTDGTSNTGIGSASAGTGTQTWLINPEVQFLINGKPMYTPPISIPNNSNGNPTHSGDNVQDTFGPAEWRRVGFTFITKPSVSGINLSFRNIAPGGSGNDLAIDNITFRPCGPRSRIRQVPVGGDFCPNGDAIQIDLGAAGAGYTAPVARIQYSCNGGVTWNNLSSLPGYTYPDPLPINTPYTDLPFGYLPGSQTSVPINFYNFSPASNPNPTVPDPNKPLVNGCLIRAIVAGNATNLSNPLCRVIVGPFTINCPNPLAANPFTLAANTKKAGIELVWNIRYEGLALEYVLERSKDGINFYPITKQTSSNSNTAEGVSYKYLDVVPYVGNNYYRVKKIDTNGEVSYSNVESAYWDAMLAGVNIYPNPADDKIFVAFSETSNSTETINVRLTSLLGVEVGTASYELQSGGNTLIIDTKKVEKGLYFIEVIRGNAKFTEKIVIKR